MVMMTLEKYFIMSVFVMIDTTSLNVYMILNFSYITGAYTISVPTKSLLRLSNDNINGKVLVIDSIYIWLPYVNEMVDTFFELSTTYD